MSLQDRLINYQGNSEEIVSVGMLLTIPPETTCRVDVDVVVVDVVRDVPFVGLVDSEVDEDGALVGALVLLVGLVVLVKVGGAGIEITVVALTFDGYIVDLMLPVTD